MKVKHRDLTPQQTLELAEQWLQRQRKLLAQCHGNDWEKHREWIEGYLLEEVRRRLIARGWRPRA